MKKNYVQRTYDIDELLVHLDAICEDDGKEISDYTQEEISDYTQEEISDYTQGEIVEEAEHCLSVLEDELPEDSFTEDKAYDKKQIRKLKKYIADFS
jgi:GTPase Era involved in 16S rRNA processing